MYIRSINQDEARLDILNTLDDHSVLVVLDWAMKFVPRKYRESQADWFGKRGMSWHISVAMRKLPEQSTLETLTLIHILQKSNQDSLYVLAIIDDVLEKLRSAIPALTHVYLRQDNAGCYHSAATILGVHQLATKHNLSVRMDFSDPQGGKGPCDRKAAAVKTHMRSYLNSGHDISSAPEMKSAIDSNGGVRGVSTILCDQLTILDSDPFPKWGGISFINDILFKTTEMRIWRAYNIGDGKDVPYSKFATKKKPVLPVLCKLSDAPSTSLEFYKVSPRRRVARVKASSDDKTKESSDTDDDTLFACSEDGCVKTFQRYSSLQKHLDVGKHKYAIERETLLDKAMLRYAQNLESGMATIDENVSEILEELQTDVSHLNMGWALKNAAATRRRFTEKQKKYLLDLFIIGEQTGRKADGSEVAKSMRKARNVDGSLIFTSDEYLTSQQIASFFSRTAAKKSITLPNTDTDDDGDDYNDDDVCYLNLLNHELEQIREAVIEVVSIKHPIIYESFNICDMAAHEKLSRFSIPMLQELCKFFELDTSPIKQKRKTPYINLLEELVSSCTC